MAFFKKQREVTHAVNHDVQIAQQQAEQMKANMRANGYDTDQLVQQAQAAMQSGAANDLVAISRRAAQLMTNGVEMPAVVRSVVVGEQNMLTGAGAPVTVGVTVQPPAKMPYEAAAQQVMMADVISQLTVGASVTVKVAPDDPQSLMVWGISGAAASAAPSTSLPAPAPAPAVNDHVERLTKLQSLRAAGAISDAEFEQQKARILAE